MSILGKGKKKLKKEEEMLRNIFNACEENQNSISYDKLVISSKPRIYTDNLCIIATAILFIVTLLGPLFFPHDSVFLSVDNKRGRYMNIVDHEVDDNEFTIYLSGDEVDVRKTYMESMQGDVVVPREYDLRENRLVFPYKSEEYNIYIYDINGNLLHLLLSPH